MRWLGPALLTLLLSGCATTASDRIAGWILEAGDEQAPIPNAQVSIRPLDRSDWRASREPEPAALLRGVGITDETGLFGLAWLRSEETFTDHRLLRRWRYEIEIQVPGYYIFRGTFTYTRGPQALTIRLEVKPADVIDVTGLVEIPEVQLAPAFGGPPEHRLDTRARRGEDPQPWE